MEQVYTTLEVIPKAYPCWADVYGEDESGIFAEFCLSGVSFAWRWIVPGRFRMGSSESENGRWSDEGPIHEVTVTKGFWLGETPVTQAQWDVVTEINPSRFRGKQLPVDSVSWHQSQEFVERVNNLVPGLPATLPTEAQWEYACRAGTMTAFNDGSDCTIPDGYDKALDQLGWFDENSRGQTHPVKGKRPNVWGLYDMHGNVWEWCRDGARAYAEVEQIDPVGTRTVALQKVVRGGCWRNSARSCRSAYRGGGASGRDWGIRGVRLSVGLDTA